VLDKTGTLTEGRPKVREIEAPEGQKRELLAVAAAAEARSEHPLAQALVKAAFERSITPPDVASFQAFPGRGVIAQIGDAEVVVGSPRFMAERNVALGALQARTELLEAAGRTVVAVTKEGRLLGVVAVGDSLRPDAIAAVATLRKAGLSMVLITGDNERAAQRIGREVGIDEVHAGILPQDKAALVRRLQADARVAMVGDGINDAPALMQADIGIAMGGGTDIALESADIIILSNRLTALAEARDISASSYRKMVQNVVLAFMFNGGGIPLAATGLIHPIWAMVAMAVSVTAIFINSLWGNPRLFFDAIRSVGRPIAAALPQGA
jgi:Cu+-exporting ATPase